MQVKVYIKSKGIGAGTECTFEDGTVIPKCTRAEIIIDASEPNRAILHCVLVETDIIADADVFFVTIEGKRYKLMEAPQ